MLLLSTLFLINTNNFFSLSLFNVLLFFTWLKAHAIFNNLETILIYFRANAQQPKLFVGMILILIFAKALALYSLIVGIILSSRAGQSRAD